VQRPAAAVIVAAIVVTVGFLQWPLVPVVLVLAPMMVGRHLEQTDARIWFGGLLVIGGILALITIAG
jgi:hypothetical protein